MNLITLYNTFNRYVHINRLELEQWLAVSNIDLIDMYIPGSGTPLLAVAVSNIHLIDMYIKEN